MILIILKFNRRGKSLWQIVADFVADTKKPLENQGVMRS
jgi:hypothetical protein